MLALNFDYRSCVAASERVAWRLDDVLGADQDLNFERAFLPESLCAPRSTAALSEHEWLKLNHITSNAYLNLFAFVEEYIIATAMNHAHAETFGDREAARALARFADEEIKHQQLFHRYGAAFGRGFGTPCGVLESAIQVAAVILAKSQMAIMMITIHLELITQEHYTEAVRPAEAELDPLFVSMLKHHWLEEAQHAKIDLLQLDKMLELSTATAIRASFEEYVDLLSEVDGLLDAQAKMDLVSLEAAIGRTLDEELGRVVTQAQHAAYRRAFILAGLENPLFRKTVGVLPVVEESELDEIATNYRSA